MPSNHCVNFDRRLPIAYFRHTIHFIRGDVVVRGHTVMPIIVAIAFTVGRGLRMNFPTVVPVGGTANKIGEAVFTCVVGGGLFVFANGHGVVVVPLVKSEFLLQMVMTNQFHIMGRKDQFNLVPAFVVVGHLEVSDHSCQHFKTYMARTLCVSLHALVERSAHHHALVLVTSGHLVEEVLAFLGVQVGRIHHHISVIEQGGAASKFHFTENLARITENILVAIPLGADTIGRYNDSINFFCE